MPEPWVLVQALVDAGLRVFVIGGHAVNFHGHIRATEDVDVIVMPDEGWQVRLLAALSGLNAFVFTDDIDPETKIEKTRPVSQSDVFGKRLIMVGCDHGYLDVFTFLPGLPDADLEEAWATSIESEGRRFVSLNWLRRLKQASGRPIDLSDLDNLPTY